MDFGPSSPKIRSTTVTISVVMVAAVLSEMFGTLAKSSMTIDVAITVSMLFAILFPISMVVMVKL